MEVPFVPETFYGSFMGPESRRGSDNARHTIF
jgi:hypothetical protein